MEEDRYEYDRHLDKALNDLSKAVELNPRDFDAGCFKAALFGRAC